MVTSRFGNVLKFGNNLITDISSDNRGRLIIATDGDGLFCYSPHDKKTTTHISTTEGFPRLSSNSVYSVFADDLGLLWVGYYQMGVEYTPKYNDLFRTYSIPESSFFTKGHAVRSLSIDGSIKVIGTRDGLFLVDESDKSVKQFPKSELRSNIIFCIKSIGNHRFLIGTYNGGMYELDAGTKRISDYNLGGAIKTTTSVFSIESDHSGVLWIGTSDGLFRYRHGQKADHWTFTNSQLPEGNVYEIFFDSADRGWICTENGMALWDGATLRKDRFPPDFIHKQKIRDVYEDSSHNLYFIPDRGKVFKSDIKISKYEHINLGTDRNLVVYFAIEDNDKHLWFGTDNGVVRYDKKNNYHHFNIADGLPSQIFTLCPPLKDKRGDLFMGNSDGLVVLDFKNFLEKNYESHHPLTVSNIMSNGKNIMSRVWRSGYQYSISLNNGESDLMVNMSDFSYKPSQYFIVEYKLDGIDENWHQTDGATPISLYDLPSGVHKLRMRLQNDSRSETILTVRKASDSNKALIAIAIIILFGGGYTLYIYRRHRLSASPSNDGETSQVSPDTENTTQIEETSHVSYQTTRLSDEECKRLLKKLDKIMAHDKPYCNPNLKSSDLASLVGTTSHALSFLFNQYLHKSYYDYVNEFRVEEFKRLVTETDISRYTMTALSEKCGFSSRTSFFRHFKAITGITPAEYVKNK